MHMQSQLLFNSVWARAATLLYFVHETVVLSQGHPSTADEARYRP